MDFEFKYCLITNKKYLVMAYKIINEPLPDIFLMLFIKVYFFKRYIQRSIYVTFVFLNVHIK
jgi:hypothetical protein